MREIKLLSWSVIIYCGGVDKTWHIVQCSSIGPLLYVIFINDLINHLKKFGVRLLKLFADRLIALKYMLKL